MMKYGFFSSKTVPIMLISAITAISVYFILQTELGGYNSDSRRISIVTKYFGITAEEIEQTITLPMEETVSALHGIEELRCCSEYSSSRIDLKLSPSVKIDNFMIELSENVDRMYSNISQISPAIQKPQILRSGIEQQPIFIVAFSHSDMPPEAVRALAEYKIKPSYCRIQDLGEIEISGGALPEIHVNIDSDRAAAAGLSAGSAAGIISNSNLYSSAGNLITGQKKLPVSIDFRLTSINNLDRIPLKEGIYLVDIASADFAYRDPENISRLNSSERVSLHIKSSSDSLISISKKLRAETLKWQLSGFDTQIVFDKGAELEKSFIKIIKALIVGMLISSLLLSVFRVDFHRIIILMIVQPFIILVTAAGLSAAGLCADNYQIAGLTIGIGMILDSALLITDSANSLNRSVRQLLSPLISSTLSTIAALIPLFSMQHEIPGLESLLSSLSLMLAVSLVVSILFIPPFYSNSAPAQAPPPDRRKKDKGLLKLASLRRRLLHPARTPSAKMNRYILISSVLLPAAAMICCISLPIQIDAPVSSASVFARVELPEGESIASSDKKIKSICTEISSLNFIESVQSVSRRGGGNIIIKFDYKEADRNTVINAIKKSGQNIPDVFLFIPEGDSSELINLTISITGPEPEKLRQISRDTLNKLIEDNITIEGVLHFKAPPPSYHYIPDNEALSDTGLLAIDAASFLRWNLQGPVADKWFLSGREHDLRVMALDYNSKTVAELCALKIPLDSSGSYKRLDQLGSFVKNYDSSRINRLNRQHSESFTISCFKTDPVKLNNSIWNVIDNIPTPPGYSFIPSAKLIEKKMLYRKLFKQFIAAVVLIFFLLSIERESLTQAAIILMQLPLLLSIPVLFVKIFINELSTETVLGLILVSGMGINNGILIIDNIESGISNAVKKRFNSLFLTTATSVIGIFPMLFTSDQFFINLAVVLISGLSGSFLVSVTIFPAILRLLKYS